MFQRKNFENRLRFDRNIMVMNLVCTFFGPPSRSGGRHYVFGLFIRVCVRAYVYARWRTSSIGLPSTSILFFLYFCHFYRTMLCIRSTSHGPVSVSVSVCLSVCLSQAGVLLKRQNVGSHKQHHTIPQRL